MTAQVVAEGAYPSREELAVLASVSISQGARAYSHAVEELVAIGANSASMSSRIPGSWPDLGGRLFAL